MIDWVDAVIEHPHTPFYGGAVLEIDPDGFVVRNSPSFQKVSGSFSSSAKLRSGGILDAQHTASQFYISFNPSKFLQGHNVVGSDDLCALVAASVEKIFSMTGQEFDPFLKRKLLKGDFQIMRIDINYMLELKSIDNVRAFIKSIEKKGKSRHGRPVMKGGTVYFGYGSTRWLFKFYSKYDELMSGKKEHSLPRELQDSPLLEFSLSKVRAELQLRKKEIVALLGKEKPLASDFNDFYGVWRLYLEKIDMTGNIALKQDSMLRLPRKLQGTYALWKQGFDLRSCMSNGTFYNHRKLFKEFGINLDLPCAGNDSDVSSHVVPFVRVLSAEPVSVPDSLKSFVFGGNQ